MKRPSGRPARDQSPPTRAQMLQTALALIARPGGQDMSMRALAAELKLTPMALYHHFGSRDGLIAALCEQVYGGVLQGGGPPDLRRILLHYHGAVQAHPNLALLIFANPGVFPVQALRITGAIREALSLAGLAPQKAQLWTHVLVDLTHGSALALAHSGGSGAEGFAEALDEILSLCGFQGAAFL